MATLAEVQGSLDSNCLLYCTKPDCAEGSFGVHQWVAVTIPRTTTCIVDEINDGKDWVQVGIGFGDDMGLSLRSGAFRRDLHPLAELHFHSSFVWITDPPPPSPPPPSPPPAPPPHIVLVLDESGLPELDPESHVTMYANLLYNIEIQGNHSVVAGEGAHWVLESEDCSAQAPTSPYGGTLDASFMFAVEIPVSGTYTLCLTQGGVATKHSHIDAVVYFTPAPPPPLPPPSPLPPSPPSPSPPPPRTPLDEISRADRGLDYGLSAVLAACCCLYFVRLTWI